MTETSASKNGYFMAPTYEDIKPYLEKKLVSASSHPEDPDVMVFNYTQLCQFEKAWDGVTRQCRGLIINVKTGEVLARPFPKFFNYQEHLANGWSVPDEEPVVTEKMDGSLGILVSVNGSAWVATRGSFESEQAKWATRWWRERYGERLENNGITRLYEIIFPANRIVVSYDFSGLVHLADIDTESGNQVYGVQPFQTVNSETEGVREVKKVPVTDLAALASMDSEEGEGFVVHFPKSDVRMKIKFPEYVRLHRIVTGVSALAVWELLRDGRSLEQLLERVPDEFYKWVKDVEGNLRSSYELIEETAKSLFAEAPRDTRKDFAIFATRSLPPLPGILFSMLDSKDYSAIIWQHVRPRGNSLFKADIDL